MMTKIALTLMLTAGLVRAGELPVLDSVEFPTLTHSAQISVHGSNLDQAGQIHIGGVPVLMVPIPGTNAVEMNGYVPDTVPFGTHPVTVTTSTGTSNALQVDVVPRAPEGRRLWRFTMNSQTMLHRPAVGADGTIYAKSAAGDLIAISPEGALEWMHPLGPDWTPTIDIGPDGTLYTADGWPRIHAINPDGTPKWTYTEPTPSQGVIAGPNVGPDGNIYVVSHVPGHGVYSLSPGGDLRWVGDDNPYSPIGQQGQEIVFSDTQLFFAQNGYFDSYDLDGDHVFRNSVITQYDDSSPQPAVGPAGDSYVEWWGQLQSYSPAGDLNWQAFGVGGSYLRDPDVGPDGTIYVMRNVYNTFHAVNPDGSTKWTYNHPHTLLHPIVSPTGDLLVIGGSGVGIENPGFYLAMDTDGNPLWQYDLPIEQYGPWTTVKVSPQGRPRFSRDGSVAYVMATGPSGYPGHSYVYALQVAPCADVGHGLPGLAGTPRLEAVGTLEAGSPITITLSQARPGATAWLVVGSETLAAPFMDGVLLPSLDLVVPLPVDASGSIQIAGDWPAGFPADTPTYVQYWIEDASGSAGWAASNALSLVTP